MAYQVFPSHFQLILYAAWSCVLKLAVDNTNLGLYDFRDRNVPRMLIPVAGDRQNIFSPVSTNIQLEQYYFNLYFNFLLFNVVL